MAPTTWNLLVSVSGCLAASVPKRVQCSTTWAVDLGTHGPQVLLPTLSPVPLAAHFHLANTGSHRHTKPLLESRASALLYEQTDNSRQT